MSTRTFQTDLRCGACVEKIRPVLDSDPTVEQWSADVSAPEKWLTVSGPGATRQHVADLLATPGYHVLGERKPADSSTTKPYVPALPPEPRRSYRPLVLILAYLLAGTAGLEVGAGGFDPMRAMAHFMAGFFLVFSFFKLLDLPAFADAYSTYDLLAARSRVYALAYPFLELGLGLAYLTRLWPTVTNWVTLVVMLVGTAGVVRTLLARRQVRCACLGAVFNLPMSYVTLTEDLLMAGMAAAMLAWPTAH